jgi:alkaline phosphatase D
MDTATFERALRARATRRMALRSAALGFGGVFGLSLAGTPTRSYARQTAPDGTPEATPQAPVPLQARSSVQFGAYPFQLGVASGDPQANSVVLWTRLAPAPLDGGGMDPIPYELKWEVAADDSFSNILQNGTAVADPYLAHSIHVEVTGLEPAREYFYRFIVGDEVSQTGRTKTAPAMGQAIDQIRFGFASCSNYEHGYFGAYRDMAAQNLDLVFHVGDYIYEYGPDEYLVRDDTNLRHVTFGETMTLQNYRNRFALYRTDLDLQAAHHSAPWVVTWDDHEIENNWAGDISENDDPVNAFLARRADAFQAYYEHMPLRPSSMPVGPDLQLYRHLNYGDLLDITVLDTRQYRTDQPSGDGTYPRTPKSVDPNTTLTGPEQERWLLQTLDQSSAVWNVIAQQVMMAETYAPIAEGEAQTYYNDSWSGYPEARARILQHIAANSVANPVVLTGDIHTAWANDLLLDWEDTSAAPVATEYVCTSITAGGTQPSDFGSAYKDLFPYIKFFDGRHGGYSISTLTPELYTTEFRLVENLEDMNSAVSTIATYATEAGSPGANPA